MAILPLESHIWVGASAGTGKTYTLTNRVLQLLLSGITPATILCLTYTNAAAAEMRLRVMELLGKWVIAEEGDLKTELSTIVETPNDAIMKRSRSLFFEISENPDSLNIQTIHGFCQSILRRFPLEAGVSPYFTVIDEEQSLSTMEQAFEGLLIEVHQGKHPEMEQHIQSLILQVTDYTFREFIKNAIRDNSRWRSWFAQEGGVNGCEAKLWEFLQLNEEPPTASRQGLMKLANYFRQQSQAQIKKLASEIESILSLVELSEQDKYEYSRAWLTNDNELRKVISKHSERGDEISALIQQESDRLIHWRYYLAHKESYGITRHLYHILFAVLERYESICQQRSYMDYHHLLDKTQRFLKKDETALGWVMYKLDGGIDHVLVDEAQDTNPLQWDIIKAITSEYFSGQGRKEQHRTLFVVGDAKQSIFGFQDADLDVYLGIRHWLEQSAKQSGQKFHEELLTKSYRSTPAIIDAVNAVTDQLEYNSLHTAHRRDLGHVEVWPVTASEEFDGHTILPPEALARHIAATIHEWLAEGRVIATTNKPIAPEDIMILVRRRTAFSTKLASELRSCQIPVQGVEKLSLKDSLAVQDILALIQWLLLPADDYSLACILRSPIANISEEQLFALSANRAETTLWEQLEQQADSLGLTAQLTLLSNLKKHMLEQNIYAFLFSLFYEHEVANAFIQRMGQEVMIVLHALLDKARQFEHTSPCNYQLFIQHIKEQQHEINSKETLGGCVRIMTIHGSKGLEAPIVILADTTDSISSISGFEWVTYKNNKVPCWLPVKAKRSPALTQTIDHAQQHSEQEDKRLLYVAMTRPRDELYISGMDKKSSRESWYDLLNACLVPVPAKKNNAVA